MFLMFEIYSSVFFLISFVDMQVFPTAKACVFPSANIPTTVPEKKRYKIKDFLVRVHAPCIITITLIHFPTLLKLFLSISGLV